MELKNFETSENSGTSESTDGRVDNRKVIEWQSLYKSCVFDILYKVAQWGSKVEMYLSQHGVLFSSNLAICWPFGPQRTGSGGGGGLGGGAAPTGRVLTMPSIAIAIAPPPS